MKDHNEEYFYFEAVGINNPMLHGPSHLFYSEEAVDDNLTVALTFYPKLVPRNPRIGDVFGMSGHPVISQRLKDHLEKLDLKNVQFVPATIKDHEDVIHENFYIIHVYNLVRCANMNKSEWTPFIRDPKQVQCFDKLILDNNVLDKIPLKSRLVIALKEENSERLYHRSVVDRILSINPIGGVFYSVKDNLPVKPVEDEFPEHILNEYN